MKKQEKCFQAVDGRMLKVVHRKSALLFELTEDAKGHKFSFHFDAETFRALIQHIDESAAVSWDKLVIKEADSFGNDYWEYYSKELDNNGYLSIKPLVLDTERPVLESLELYKFNKAKMGTFLFDARACVEKMKVVHA